MPDSEKKEMKRGAASLRWKICSEGAAKLARALAFSIFHPGLVQRTVRCGLVGRRRVEAYVGGLVPKA